jgi:hypothetical protein
MGGFWIPNVWSAAFYEGLGGEIEAFYRRDSAGILRLEGWGVGLDRRGRFPSPHALERLRVGMSPDEAERTLAGADAVIWRGRTIDNWLYFN